MVWEVQVGVIFLCFWGVCFKIVFWSSWGRFWGRFGDHFGSKIAPKSKKKRDWFWDRFLVPRLEKMRETYPLFPGRGGPWGTPHKVKRFSEQETSVWARNKKTKPKQEKGSAVLIIVQIIVDFCWSLFRLLLNFVFHKLMLVIWHALGKARRI